MSAEVGWSLEERLAEAAEAHRLTTPVQCAYTCGWRETAPGAGTWGAHLADVAAQVFAEWLGEREQREAVAEELLNVGHEPPRPSYAEVAFMDVKHAADAALAALTDRIDTTDPEEGEHVDG